MMLMVNVESLSLRRVAWRVDKPEQHDEAIWETLLVFSNVLQHDRRY